MRNRYYKYLLFSLTLMLVIFHLEAQVELTSSTDAGKTNVSEGGFLKAAALGRYSFNNFRVNSGLQLEPVSNG